MELDLKELLPFLHDKAPQVRRIALSHLVGHTAKDSPNRNIFLAAPRIVGPEANDIECIRDLKLLCQDDLAAAHDAFRALVNLSENSTIARSLFDPSFLTFLVSYIITPSSILADLASMILSNITAFPSACASLIALKVPITVAPSASPPFFAPRARSGSNTVIDSTPSEKERTMEVLALPLLVQVFVQAAKVDASAEKRAWKGDLHFLASVFANITTAAVGRLFFLTPRPADVLATGTDGELEYPLSQLVVFTEHADTIRRGGVASTIKHCAFHVPAHKAMLFHEAESVAVPPSNIRAPGINALPYVLLPLAGPEEFDLEDQEKLHPLLQLLPDTKKRELDDVLRLTHVETLILFCTTRGGREYLRKNGAYEIVRTMHLSEKSENVREHIERLVNLLKGEEKPIEEVDGNEWSHCKIGLDDEDDRKKDSSTYDSDAGPVASLLDGDSDDDDKIVEV